MRLARLLRVALLPALAGCSSTTPEERAPGTSSFVVSLHDYGAGRDVQTRAAFVARQPEGPTCHRLLLDHTREGSVLRVRVAGTERMQPCSVVALPPGGAAPLDLPGGTYTLLFTADERMDVYRLVLGAERARLVPVTTTFSRAEETSEG